MAYIFSRDYLKQIQSGQLSQLQTSDSGILSATEIAAETEVKSHLQQKYDTALEFTDTAVWSNSTTYKAANRVYLDATAFSSSTSYVSGDLVLYESNVYRANASHTGAWDASNFDKIAAQYTLYYVSYPKPKFDLYKEYAKDDEVWYKDRTYKCLIASQTIYHEQALQYRVYENIPVGNIFPDDAKNGSKYWQDLGAYTVAAGTLPTDDTKWTQGDNRDQNILMKTVDIALYHLHSRIAPQNIPQLRQNRYDDALNMLKAAAKGNITIDMPLKQSKKGNRIRYGGNVKRINGY